MNQIVMREMFDALEKSGKYVCFEFLNASVGFYCDDNDFVEWLSKCFGGYFVPSQRQPADAVIYSSQDASLFEDLQTLATSSGHAEAADYSELQLDSQHYFISTREVDKKNHVEETCYIVSQAGKRVLVASPGSVKVRRETIKRTIRNMMKLLLIERGWLPLHASACVKNGVGICILGGKFAGKTSTLINLLAQSDATLVSNDTLFLRDAGTHLEGCGFPSEAGLRVGTLLANPELLQWIGKTSDSFYPQIDAQTVREIVATTPAAELGKRPEKIILLATELAEMLQIAIQPITPIQLFLAVQFDPALNEARLVPMDEEQIISQLAPHFRSLSAVKKQGFLQSLFDFNETHLRMKFVSLLTKYASEVVFCELHQNAGTNAHAEVLVDALTHAYAPALENQRMLSATGPL